MRKIKYRGYLKKDRKMLPVAFLNFNGVDPYDVFLASCGDLSCGMCEDSYKLEEVEIMQYTGFEDDEDTEIYEGDIIEFCDFNSLRTGGIEDDVIHVSVIKMSEGSWMVENGKHRDYLYQVLINDSDAKVIGNIYENKELLQEEL